MSKNIIPTKFFERLKGIIPQDCFDSVSNSFNGEPHFSIRVNYLQEKREQVQEIVPSFLGQQFKPVEWCQDVFIGQEGGAKEAWLASLIEQGKVYQQGLSSVLAGAVVNPSSEDRVLDLCAAPGSKTSHLAQIMNNQGEIVAIEHVKARFYTLRSVLELLGVQNVKIKLMDGRRFRSDELFDKILVDAPCSSEGRFKTSNPKSFAYWSERKIHEMNHKQKGLVWNALRSLKPGGVLTYSTCTFAPEENEEVVSWILKKGEGSVELQDVVLCGKPVASWVKTYPALLEWKNRKFHPSVSQCLRLLPSPPLEGFFIAQMRKR
jgi:16S rRNA (cytosine1407-C5)-methyltransferase